MISIDPKDVSTAKLHHYLLSAVAPRPIAFASTVNEAGLPNLSPFSFFNVFSANPPILIFSPSRRVRDNTVKHTLVNIEKTKEVVINIVNYALVQQASLSSVEYPEGINEFVKAGLTALPSNLVKPFRVAESPVHIECKVNDIIPLGTNGGAGNLIICEVVKLHLNEYILDVNKNIDPLKIDLVSRMGGNWYSRASKGLFEVPKPSNSIGIGIDAIPDFIKNSGFFDGNDLGLLGNIETLPTKEEIITFAKERLKLKSEKSQDDALHIYLEAKKYLNNQDILSAWKVLLSNR